MRFVGHNLVICNNVRTFFASSARIYQLPPKHDGDNDDDDHDDDGVCVC